MSLRMPFHVPLPVQRLRMPLGLKPNPRQQSCRFSTPARQGASPRSRTGSSTSIASRAAVAPRRSITSRPRHPRPPPFPTVSTCPSPTCACAETPAMPDGLEIDRANPLNGVMAGYAEHVVVCTGKDDWPSRIEEENNGDNLAADLKELFGRGGKYTDPFHHVSVINSSFPSSAPPRTAIQSTSAYLLPSFKYVPFLPRVSFDSVKALAKGFLLPERLHAAHAGLSPAHRDRLTRKEAFQGLLPGVRDVADVLVLICGHGGRDLRCGIMGPVLRDEFEDKLGKKGFTVAKEAVQVGSLDGSLEETKRMEGSSSSSSGGGEKVARVGLISHIGGHKFAGNVIIYIPPGFAAEGGERHPLAGCGIWYGRVEPKHVEGIVGETVMAGRVVEDMFRGGIDAHRRILRL
ncbi:Sucrase/ferredoxin-like domain-containing protein [Trichoderma novae-zelandiae]